MAIGIIDQEANVRYQYGQLWRQARFKIKTLIKLLLACTLFQEAKKPIKHKIEEGVFVNNLKP